MTQFVDTWRGDVTLSECDELGHLNMRYYLSKARQARQTFFMMLGLPHSFELGTPSTVRFRECHIKFLKEARPAMSLSIQTGLLALRDTEIDLLHMMYHRDGELAATIVETVDHIYLRTGETFPWPKRVIASEKTHTVTCPDIAKPRGVSLDTPMIGPSLSEIAEFPTQAIGQGVFVEKEADPFNYVCAHNYVGRLSDTITSFTAGWPEIAEESWDISKVVGVMLEFRLRVHRPARPGRAYQIHSGVQSHTDKVRRIVHNFINPITGLSYASFIAVNGLINLETRRFALPSEDNLKRLSDVTIPGLSA